MTGVFILFKIKQSNVINYIEKQIEQGIPEEELHAIKFSHKEYQHIEWTRAGKEFRLGNNLYDVVHIEKTKDFVQLECVYDREEVELLAQLDHIIQKTMGQHSKDRDNNPLNKVLKIFKGACIMSDFAYHVETHSLYILSYSQTHNFLYNSPVITKTVPPPDCV